MHKDRARPSIEQNNLITFLPKKMDNDFEILSNFLDSVEPEVSGRSAAPVSDADRSRIEQFARGQLSDSERDALLPSLAENETALQLLVEALGRQS